MTNPRQAVYDALGVDENGDDAVVWIYRLM